MFFNIALFELRYQLKNPVFWVVTILFGLLAFGAMTFEGIQIGSGGNVLKNSPAAIVQISQILSLFYIFVTTAFVANVVVRDDESGFAAIVRSTSMSKFNYLIGRFTGAYLVACISFLVIPLAIWIGSMMPWIDSEQIGPNMFAYYAWPTFFLAFPNILISSAIFFTVATMTRSMMYSYVAAVAFLVLYFTTNALMRQNIAMEDFAALVDAFGIAATGDHMQNWTPIERNTLLPTLTGNLLWNRVIWCLVAVGLTLLACWRFRFGAKGASARKLKKQARKAEKLAQTAPQIVETLPSTSQNGVFWTQFKAQCLLEMRMVFRSPAFFVLIFIGIVNAFSILLTFKGAYGTANWPVTFNILELIIGSFSITPLLIAIYYAGELVWRDRDRKFNEIIDSTPLSNWGYMLPKSLALSLVLITTILVSVLVAVIAQMIKGYFHFEMGKYLLWYVLPFSIDMIILSILAIFLQALSPNKYVGWGLMVVYMVGTITFYSLGFENPLYQYGEVGQQSFSDLNGNNVGFANSFWLRVYWIGWAIILAVLAHLLWRRGTESRLKNRLALMPARLKGASGAIMACGVVIAGATGAWVFYNLNIVNDFQTSDEIEEQQAEYEKKYLKYQSLVQPAVEKVKYQIDIYPETPSLVASGTISIINDKQAPIKAIHLRFLGDEDMSVERLDVDGAKRSHDDREFDYYIFDFDSPLKVGEKRTIHFKTVIEQKGFRSQNNQINVVENGTFVDNSAFAPVIGMSSAGLLSDRAKRRKYGLPAELRLPKLEDMEATKRNYVMNADWVTSEITVSTSADQIPIAPGKMLSEKVENGRKIAHFVSSQPILNFFSVQSARYAVKEKQSNGINFSVYYHQDHDFNVDTMLNAADISLDYYQKNFGAYQFDYFRILEYPGYRSFAQAFAGTIPYSEKIGFLADLRDKSVIDYATYVTAHEAAHQYWAHQLISAEMQGGTLLVETMAQYSALMVMKQIYGADNVRRFLKYELDSYLNGRGFERLEELPLNRVENQAYIHYRKGAVVMYLLQDRLGEDRVNGVLAELLNQYRFKGAPFARSTDLVNRLKGLARNDAERQLVSDAMEKITIYDFTAHKAVTRKLPDGRYETAITIAAAKYYADGEGKEKPAHFADEVAIGLFTKKPGFDQLDKNSVLYKQRHPIKSGEQLVKIITKKRPIFAGVDPYITYIDRDSDDNIVAVEGK